MAYATYGDVSNHMVVPAFSATTTPTSTQVTSAITQADLLIDNYIQGATIDSNTLQLASCMITAMMIMRGRKYLIEADTVFEIAPPLLTSEVKALLDREMAASDEIAIIVSNQTSYQTASDPDDFV